MRTGVALFWETSIYIYIYVCMYVHVLGKEQNGLSCNGMWSPTCSNKVCIAQPSISMYPWKDECKLDPHDLEIDMCWISPLPA